MKRLLSSLAGLAIFITVAAQVTADDAFEKVRSLCPNANYAYYTASVESITNDLSSPVDLSQYGWIRDGRDYWLVFVDKKHMHSWCHECSYYYMPKDSVISTNDMVVINTDMPPVGVNLDFKGFFGDVEGYTYGESLSSTIQRIKNSPTSGVVPNERTKVIIIGTGLNKWGCFRRYYNDCALLYTSLVHTYNVNKDDISLLICGGESDRTVYFNNNNIRDTIQMPLDIDGDGVDETIRRANLANLEDVIDSISNDTIDHLFVYFAGDIIPNITMQGDISYELALYNNHVTVGKFNQLLAKANAKYNTIIINGQNSSYFTSQFEAPGRVIMTDSELEKINCIYVDVNMDVFTVEWAAAIIGENVIHEAADADSNQDGIVAMKESFDFVYNRMLALTQGYNLPSYSSVLASTGQDLSFETLPKDVDLYMRDFIDDTGVINANTAKQKIYWDSPDIWCRNQDDGITNQESEIISEAQGTAHIYTRISNRGIYDSPVGNAVVDIYWIRNTLNVTQAEADCDTLVGGLIASIPIAATIPSDSSAIAHSEWTIPQHLLSLTSFTGGVLPVNFIAEVKTDTTTNHIDRVLTPYLSNDIAAKRAISIDPSSGSLRKVVVAPTGKTVTYHGVQIPVRISNNDYHTANSQLYFTADSLASDLNVFNGVELAIELTDSLYACWDGTSVGFTVDSTNPKRLKANSINSCLTGLHLKPFMSDSIVVSCHIDARKSVLEQSSHRFHIALDHAGGPDIMSCEIILQPHRTLSPKISDTPLQANLRLLKVEDINEPAAFYWYDSGGNLLSENDSIVVPTNNTESSYMLKTIAESDGAVAYSTTTVMANNQAADISYNDITKCVEVHLSQAISGEIIISPLDSTSQVCRIATESDNTNYLIDANGLDKGIYVVAITCGGSLLTSQCILIK